MYKNIVFIIVDSLCQDNVGKGYSGMSTTPFLDSIEQNGIVAANVYSQGPYTEAGTKSLLCGEDTLSSGGYLLRYANSKTFITDVFKENGYETYCYMYPNALLSQKSLKCTDHMLYTSGFDLNVIWKQKLVYYLERYKKGILDEKDIEDCVNVVELTLESWKSFFCPYKENESYLLIEEYIKNYDLKMNTDKLLEQYTIFFKDKKKFVQDLFERGEHHLLFDIVSLDMRQMIKTDTITEAFSKHKTFVKNFRKKQIILNLKNNKYPLYQMIKDFFGFIIGRKKEKLLKLYNYYTLLGEANDVKKCQTKKDYKVVVSAKTIFDDLNKRLTEETNNNRFFFVHIEDTHYFSTFFSYDSKEKDVIEKEITAAEEYLKGIDGKYRGNLFYDFSIRYVDGLIKDMFDNLMQNDIYKDTLICVTADHGYSFNRFPVRDSVVNNLHGENYHIPFYLINSSQKFRYNSLMLGKDIVATLYDECEFDIPDGVTGISILNNRNKRDSVIIEYMGPGCPDIRNRKAWFSARSKTRVVSVKTNVFQEKITYEDIDEVYNLIDDPLEEKNIVNMTLDDESRRLFEQILDRIVEIREEYK